MGWVEDRSRKITDNREYQEVLSAVLLHAIIIPGALAGYLLTELIVFLANRLSPENPWTASAVFLVRVVGLVLLLYVVFVICGTLIATLVIGAKALWRRIKDP